MALIDKNILEDDLLTQKNTFKLLYLAEWKHKAGKADDSAPAYDDIDSSPSASITELKKENMRGDLFKDLSP
jgi:hypothetical protein